MKRELDSDSKRGLDAIRKTRTGFYWKTADWMRLAKRKLDSVVNADWIHLVNADWTRLLKHKLDSVRKTRTGID